MKKLIVLALCLVAALAFTAGCKKKEVAEQVAPAQAAVSSVKAPVAAPAPAAAPVEKKK